MRLFVAIPLSDNVKRELQELQQPIRGVQWQSSDQFHITLRFIGNVKQEIARAIHQQLTSICFSPFDFDVRGIGYFPEKRRPRVLWVGLEKVPPLMRLQQEVEQACQDAGLEPEKREYKPHITLGKVKGASKQEVMSFIDQHNQFEAGHVHVKEFILYSSRLHSDGAIHTPEEKYPLD